MKIHSFAGAWFVDEFVLPGQNLERNSQLKIENIRALAKIAAVVMINAVVRRRAVEQLYSVHGALTTTLGGFRSHCHGEACAVRRTGLAL